MRRRVFLRSGLCVAGNVAMTNGFAPLLAAPRTTRLTILHTNDVHSRIDPFPMDGSRNAGLGGAARRAKLIEEIRLQEENVLLLDSGDIFQGTPYFNYFGGEIELKLMSAMGYDAATIGNHDFDVGVDGLARQLPHADFPLISSNYDFSDTEMAGKTIPYQIFEKSGIRIGIFGLGIELQGLVPDKLYGQTRYLDPLSTTRKMATYLKLEKRCDYIICLSHLGYKYDGNKIDDIKLASQIQYVDLILGGHTHTFMKEPHVLPDIDKNPVIINQVGWGGMSLGRVDITFERNRKNRCLTCRNIIIK